LSIKKCPKNQSDTTPISQTLCRGHSKLYGYNLFLGNIIVRKIIKIKDCQVEEEEMEDRPLVLEPYVEDLTLGGSDALSKSSGIVPRLKGACNAGNTLSGIVICLLGISDSTNGVLKRR